MFSTKTNVLEGHGAVLALIRETALEGPLSWLIRVHLHNLPCRFFTEGERLGS